MTAASKPYVSSPCDCVGAHVINTKAPVGGRLGWSAVLENLQAGIETAKYTGPHGSGGFWADGSLLLTRAHNSMG